MKHINYSLLFPEYDNYLQIFSQTDKTFFVSGSLSIYVSFAIRNMSRLPISNVS